MFTHYFFLIIKDIIVGVSGSANEGGTEFKPKIGVKSKQHEHPQHRDFKMTLSHLYSSSKHSVLVIDEDVSMTES